MKKGFTMIELIFVIVILGILAAVAIPRLAATRNDATASTLATSAATCVNDAGGEYMMTGTFDTGGAADTVPNSPACTDTQTAPAGTTTPCYTLAVRDAQGQLDITGSVAGSNTATDVCNIAVNLTNTNGLTNGTTLVTHQF